MNMGEFFRLSVMCRLDNRDDDDYDDDRNDSTDNKAHLHVFPPHVFSDTISPATETLGRYGQVVSLVL